MLIEVYDSSQIIIVEYIRGEILSIYYVIKEGGLRGKPEYDSKQLKRGYGGLEMPQIVWYNKCTAPNIISILYLTML